MKELLTHLTSQEVRTHMRRVDVQTSYVESVATELGQSVYGQPEACRALARRISMFEAGLSDPHHPLGVAFFLGPTGVGKTEAAHALARHMFKDPDSPRMKIIDCSELNEPHTVHRFTGAPQSYIGYGDPGIFESKWLHTGRSIIVFDEIEKAHPAIHRLLLGVMEDGRMKVREREGNWNAKEVTLDFSNSVIIFTSNAGAEAIAKAQRGGGMGFRANTTPTKTIDEVGRDALKRQFAFMPEFLGRIDDVVVFKPLEREHYEKIYWKFITELNHDLITRNPQAPFIATTEEFKDWILSKLDYTFGARNLRHVLDVELLERLADVFNGMDVAKKPLVADYEDDQVYFYTDTIEEAPPLPPTPEPLQTPLAEFLTEEGKKLLLDQPSSNGVVKELPPPEDEGKKKQKPDEEKKEENGGKKDGTNNLWPDCLDLYIRVNQKGQATKSIILANVPIFPVVPR